MFILLKHPKVMSHISYVRQFHYYLDTFYLLLMAQLNKRARVLRQNLARGLSYVGSPAVRLRSKRQKMSRNNLWEI